MLSLALKWSKNMSTRTHVHQSYLSEKIFQKVFDFDFEKFWIKKINNCMKTWWFREGLNWASKTCFDCNVEACLTWFKVKQEHEFMKFFIQKVLFSWSELIHNAKSSAITSNKNKSKCKCVYSYKAISVFRRKDDFTLFLN